MQRITRRLTAMLPARFTRSIDNERGSIPEAIVGTVISFLIIGIIGTGTVSAISALSTTTSNAERTQKLTVMAGKPSLIPGWDKATDSSISHDVTLPSGTKTTAYLWSSAAPNGTNFIAAMPRSGNLEHTTECADTKTIHADSCVYATAFDALDPRSVLPPAVPGFTVAPLASPIAARTPIASFTAPAVSTDYRFYIRAAAVGAEGEIHFTQGNLILSIIPVSKTADDYFGTVTVPAGATVTIDSPDRSMDVSRVLVYKAGTR